MFYSIIYLMVTVSALLDMKHVDVKLSLTLFSLRTLTMNTSACTYKLFLIYIYRSLCMPYCAFYFFGCSIGDDHSIDDPYHKVLEVLASLMKGKQVYLDMKWALSMTQHWHKLCQICLQWLMAPSKDEGNAFVNAFLCLILTDNLKHYTCCCCDEHVFAWDIVTLHASKVDLKLLYYYDQVFMPYDAWHQVFTGTGVHCLQITPNIEMGNFCHCDV